MLEYQKLKTLVLDFYHDLEAATPGTLEKVLKDYTLKDFQWYGVHPFGEQKGAEAVVQTFWNPFLDSWRRVQRRQDIFFAGTSEIDQTDWVVSMGHLMGLLDRSWLGIPPSRKMTFLRYADFHCIEDGKITRSAFFCDLIGVMHQQGIQPLPPQTGASF
ncbi:MAG: nuclear transport factor 2 family protein, partial [SAR324 cluster bacterium]|nr:nuclear transport factor 2 family protein [SAR324 cluster bacterium]